jgi:DNA (cytosine-5)-methyltransferase 1
VTEPACRASGATRKRSTTRVGKDLKSGNSGSRHTLLSLFTGAGGLDLGLEMAGFETRAASELEAHACETLRCNKAMCKLGPAERDDFIQRVLTQRCYHGLAAGEAEALVSRLRTPPGDKFLQSASIVEGDIRQVSSDQLRSACGLGPGERPFCIAGGPPCQPFSRAGKRQAVDDAKNGDLFFEFVRVVRDLKPDWFLFENVKGLLLTKTDVLMLRCNTCSACEIAPFQVRMAWGRNQPVAPVCEKCGSKKVSAESREVRGGSLQIIIKEFERTGYRCDHRVLNAADFGAPQVRERLFIVGSRDSIPFEWPTPTHSESPRAAKQASLQMDLFDRDPSVALKPWRTMFEALWSRGHPQYRELDPRRAVLWVKNVVRPHDEPVTWSLDRPSPTIGAHQGAKLAIAPHGVPDDQIQRQQWHTRGRRQGDSSPVRVEHAYLTDEELLHLQTFPSWWYLHGTRMQRAFQIGNAVPPLLAYEVGKAIIRSSERVGIAK